MELRPYRESDFEAVFELDQLCFSEEFRFSRASMRRFLQSRRARTTVAEDGGGIAGFCLGHIEPSQGGSVGYVVTLDVGPEFRRGGVGRDLLDAFAGQAREEGCFGMVLHVSMENGSASAFYERLGWERVHTAADFYGDGMDALVYRKGL